MGDRHSKYPPIDFRIKRSFFPRYRIDKPHAAKRSLRNYIPKIATMLGNYGTPTNGRSMDYATVGWIFSSASASGQDAERLGERLMKDAYIDVNIGDEKQNKTKHAGKK